uniref:Uncharacterized protein n=1 Tax=Acrobeloides nanus TaxID=290746 RepID=A0A914E598_9BILA
MSSICASHRSSSFFRPLPTADSTPKMVWFSSALKGLNESTPSTSISSGPSFTDTITNKATDVILSPSTMSTFKRPAPPPPDNISQNYPPSTGPPLPPRTSVKPLPTPLNVPPPEQNNTINGSRKSISSKYLENKRQQLQQNVEEHAMNGELAYDKKELTMNIRKSEKPYGDDVIVSTDEEVPFSPTRAKHFEELIKQAQNSPSDTQNQLQNGNHEEEDFEDDGIQLISQKKTNAFDEDSFLHHKSTPPISRSDFLRNANQANQDSDSELEDDDHDTYSFNERISVREVSMLASDGNPVRHSLLNLVCEEDIPELLEAMAEECHFVFEDYTSNMASTSSIIHTQAKRTERRKQRNVNRIAFVNEPPKVFAYLDENSALEDGEWIEGNPISYEDYQKILHSSQEQQAQQISELSKWRQAMEQKYAEIEEVSTNGLTPSPNIPNRATSPNDSSMGVTSKFSYGSVPTQCSQPIQIRTADCGTSAI